VLEQDPGERLSRAQHTSGVAAAASLRGVDDPEWTRAQLSRLDLLLRTLVEPNALARLLLLDLAPLLGAARGAIYTLNTLAGDGARLVLAAHYAAGAELPESLALGEGLVGQCALAQRKLVIRDVPADHFRVHSALGTSLPRELVFVPVWLTETCRAILELAFFAELPASRAKLLDGLYERRPYGTAEAASLFPPPGPPSAAESPASNGVPTPWARQPGPGAATPSPPGAEPPAPPALAPRASQRSGFWGKLSHELRSPLNSVLVLSKLLSENAEDNLTAKQVAFAQAIHASGSDLLGLVNAISDLAKIETNRLVLEPTEMPFQNFRAHLERAYEPLARSRDLEFVVELEPELPAAIVTDAKRLRQIIKCLLSNAFKFTESGRVSVKVARRNSGWSPDRARLNDAHCVVAFAVTDTGIGMSESEVRSILDLFPPDQIESRRASGASGLGMAISRELATLLGGELRVESAVGSGSTFTLYLPTCGLGGVVREEPTAELPSGVAVAHPVPAPSACEAPSREATPPAAPVEPSSRRSVSARSRKRRDGGEAVASELSGLEIMLVDDDVRSAFALTGLLERGGAAVSHAEDVAEALERLSEGQSTSVLLIDGELLSGSEESVQHMLQRYGAVPIIALTRKPRPAREGTPADVGRPIPPHVYQLPKPVDPRQLMSILRSVALQSKSLQSRAP
jgi:CheY-like chemotaxis protein/two-component sensor histidine kinase